MAKLYNTKGNRVIIYHIKRKNYTKTQIAKLLNVSNATIHKYLNNPYTMSLQQLILLCGLFGCSIEELVYLISKNKAKLNKEGFWYLEDIRMNADIKQMAIEKL